MTANPLTIVKPLSLCLPWWSVAHAAVCNETNQIYVVAFTMFRDFEQIEHTQKTGLARQLRSNIDEPDQGDRIDLDFSLSHAVKLPSLTCGLVQILMLQVISP
jgi:hypothetical protein